jgi:hypothetical protein
MRFTALLLLGATACHAEIQPTDDPELTKACAIRSVPGQPLRRLSSRQWKNVMTDLLGRELAEPLLADSIFPETAITGGFTNDAAVNTVNTSQSNQIEDEALRIAGEIIDNPDPYLAKLLPCGSATDISDACIESFIREFGRRAYRRPLADGEVVKIRALFDSLKSQSTKVAWAGVVQFFVQSPSLLYRIERGNGVAGPGALEELDSYAVASRLSFLFTDSGPDAELAAAADRGELATPAQIEAQARRLLTDPRFTHVVADFHHDWLRLYESNAKSPALFPAYTEAVQRSLSEEVGELTRYIVEANGTIGDVLGMQTLPVDQTSAGYYGVSAPSTGFSLVDIPNRKGVLTLASVQAGLSAPDQTRLFHRASFVYHDVLCEAPLGEPADFDAVAAALSGTADLPTARERNAPTATNGGCAGCHERLNPLAFAFENFDAAGGWRDRENGALIDASGSYDLGTDRPELVSFGNAAELVTAIAGSARAQRCYTLQWFRSSTGRSDLPEDRCSTAQLQALVRTHGGDLRELMVALTQIDAFRYRTQEN